MKSRIQDFLSEESGATAIEYGLICAIISMGLITALQLISPELTGTFTEIQTGLASR